MAINHGSKRIVVGAHYGSGDLTLTLTTDPQPVAEPASISVLEAA